MNEKRFYIEDGIQIEDADLPDRLQMVVAASAALNKHIALETEKFLRRHIDKLEDHALVQYPDERWMSDPDKHVFQRLIALVPKSAWVYARSLFRKRRSAAPPACPRAPSTSRG